MEPYNQPGWQSEQSTQGGFQQGQSEQVPPADAPVEEEPISEMVVSTPTLRWVSIDHPQTRIPLGPDDYVLDSVYNHQIDAWEVLVLVEPREQEASEDEE
jgi:hypothetical protein